MLGRIACGAAPVVCAAALAAWGPGAAGANEPPVEPDGRMLAGLSAASLDELAGVYNTPAKVWWLLEHAVSYTFDRQVWGHDEYFATAEELWTRKRGDCEDYAALAKALLERNGYTTVLFSAWRQERDAGGNDGHTVVAFLEQGRWNHISNLGYVRAEAVSHEELAASIFPNWTRSNTWVYTGPALSRDGLNGWRIATMVANRGAGGRTVVRTELPALATASGN